MTLVIAIAIIAVLFITFVVIVMLAFKFAGNPVKLIKNVLAKGPYQVMSDRADEVMGVSKKERNKTGGTD